MRPFLTSLSQVVTYLKHGKLTIVLQISKYIHIYLAIDSGRLVI